MRKSLLVVLFFIISLSLQAQKDSVPMSAMTKGYAPEVSNIKISIYPVPVRKNSFTIKCNSDISSVKITNIIGQDIFKAQYKNPQPVTEIFLANNQKRGMYLVTVVFSNGTRVVKKIMIEERE
jgi:hypothetical protein